MLTPGRYYFVPESTPFYPYGHHLGSRDWTSEERDDATMGEWDGPQVHDKGEPPLIVPELRIVGNVSCVENGGGGPDLTVGHAGFDDYLPAGCYKPFDRGDPARRINACPDLALIARCMAEVNDFPVTSVATAQEIVGPGCTVRRFDDGGDASVSDEAWQFCDGTRNKEQLLSQAYGTAGGPTVYGRYSATPLYQHYATRLLSRFTALGAVNKRRYVLVGHSYGGAAAAVAAVRLKIQDPTRSVTLLTFGAPRAGGADLVEALKGVNQRHLVRPNDPIPFLPPQPEWYHFLFVSGLLVPFWRGWGVYESYQFSAVVTPAGIRDREPNEVPTTGDMTAIVGAILAPGALPHFDSHGMQLYANEIATKCGVPQPFPP